MVSILIKSVSHISNITKISFLIKSLIVALPFIPGLFIIVTPNYVINISSYPIPDGLAGEIFCRLIFSKFFIFTFGKGSVLTITCLAIERWFALIKPWQYQATFCSRKLCKYIAFIWLTSMLTQSYKFFYVQFSQRLCFFIPLPVVEKSVETSLIAVYVSATFFCPTIITWTAFIHIYVKINKSNVLKVNRGKEEKRTLLKMSAITSLMLTVCWFPTEVSYIINQYGFPILNFGTPFREFTVLLALANSFINPWIYIGTSRRYRQTLMEFFRSVAVY